MNYIPSDLHILKSSSRGSQTSAESLHICIKSPPYLLSLFLSHLKKEHPINHLPKLPDRSRVILDVLVLAADKNSGTCDIQDQVADSRILLEYTRRVPQSSIMWLAVGKTARS